MWTFNNSKCRHEICLKLGYLLSASLTKLVPEAKASIYSTIKQN